MAFLGGILDGGKGPLGLPTLNQINEAVVINRDRAMNHTNVGTPGTGAGSPSSQAGVNVALGGTAIGAGIAGSLIGASETAAAGAGGAGAGGATAKATTAATKAASAGLTKDVLAGGLAVGVAELAKAYGVRILEVTAGAGLIYFGLLTLAKGGTPPSIPKAIPVPV